MFDLSEITLLPAPALRYGGDKTEEELEALLPTDTMRELVSCRRGLLFRPPQPGLGWPDSGQPG